MELDELAAHANSFFVAKQRSGGETFWSLKTPHPEWVLEMVHKAHGDILPEDYKYLYVVEALDALEEGRNPEEPELEPDIYTGELLKWIGSGIERPFYVDEAVGMYGHSDQGIVSDIAMGQLYEMEEIFRIVVDALQERLEAIEAGEPETFEDKTRRPRSPKDWSPHR